MPRKYTADFTFGELTQLVDVVKNALAQTDYSVGEYAIGPDAELRSWSVSDAEANLVKRANLRQLVDLLTGDDSHEDPEVIARVEAARVRYDAEQAAALANQED